MTLHIIGIALIPTLAVLSGWCGWMACWLWTNRTRQPRTGSQPITAGGLRRPVSADTGTLLAADGDRVRARHRHSATSLMFTQPGNPDQVSPIQIPDPRAPIDATTVETRMEVAS